MTATPPQLLHGHPAAHHIHRAGTQAAHRAMPIHEVDVAVALNGRHGGVNHLAGHQTRLAGIARTRALR